MDKEPLYIRIDPGGSPPADPPLSPYLAVVAIESQVSPEWRAKLIGVVFIGLGVWATVGGIIAGSDFTGEISFGMVISKENAS